LSLESILKVIRGIVRLRGATDNTLIGNENDSLKVFPTNKEDKDFSVVSFRDHMHDRLRRLRISNRVTLAEHAHTLGKGGRYWDEKITGDASASWDADKWAVISSSGLQDGAKIERQTFRVMQYFKGASALAHWSINFVEARAGCTKCFMVGDQFNGVGLQLNGSTLQMLIRSDVSGSVVDITVDQSAWTKDKLDGTGPSGLTLDVTKEILFEISYAHLGSGPITLVIHIGGKSVVVHEFITSNSTAMPWAKTGSLPMRTEMTNTSVQGTETTMRLNCASFASESGDVTQGLVLTHSSGTSAISVSGTDQIISGIRLDPNTRYLSLLPLGYNMKTESGNKFVYWKIVYRPTIVGGVWSDINSVVEKLDSYTSFSGGFIIAEGQFDLSVGEVDIINLVQGQLNRDAYLGYSIDHDPEALILTGQTEKGSGKVFFSTLHRIFL